MLDRVKRCKLEVVVTTHDTARTHVVHTYLHVLIGFVEEMIIDCSYISLLLVHCQFSLIARAIPKFSTIIGGAEHSRLARCHL